MTDGKASDSAPTTSDAREMGYCFRIPGCGCVVAAQIDGPEYKRQVASFKKKHPGFELAYLPVEEIRALPWGWPCEHLRGAQAKPSTAVKDQSAGRGA